LDPNIAEINILGTGGGYGESIVAHIGNNDWIVIDSCKDPNSKKCLPLEFLKEKKVDLNNVKLILCTHWHDDHILGISDILRASENCSFSCARANDRKKFLRFISLDYQKIKTSSQSSTKEFNQCLDILNERKKPIKSAEIDKLLYSSELGEHKIEVYSLSPSDLSCDLFDLEISSLITNYGKSNKKIIKESPNHRSVATLIKIGKISLLLGADLEVKKDRKLGWFDIIDNSQIIKISNKSVYFKIPHHGSENGFSSEIFSELLVPSPLGTLTPWNKNKGLPTLEMVKTYKAITSDLYITSYGKYKSKPKKRNAKVNKLIKRFNPSIQEVKYQFGVISTRFNIFQDSKSLETNVQGAGKKL